MEIEDRHASSIVEGDGDLSARMVVNPAIRPSGYAGRHSWEVLTHTHTHTQSDTHTHTHTRRDTRRKT